MIDTLKVWIHVLLAWLSVGLAWVVVIIGKYSAFLAGLASIVAISFTIWQWRKAASKEKRKHKERSKV